MSIKCILAKIAYWLPVYLGLGFMTWLVSTAAGMSWMNFPEFIKGFGLVMGILTIFMVGTATIALSFERVGQSKVGSLRRYLWLVLATFCSTCVFEFFTTYVIISGGSDERYAWYAHAALVGVVSMAYLTHIGEQYLRTHNCECE